MGGGGIDWFDLVRDGDRGGNEPSGSINCGEFLE